jgi:hypothetical protein
MMREHLVEGIAAVVLAEWSALTAPHDGADSC